MQQFNYLDLHLSQIMQDHPANQHRLRLEAERKARSVAARRRFVAAFRSMIVQHIASWRAKFAKDCP